MSGDHPPTMTQFWHQFLPPLPQKARKQKWDVQKNGQAATRANDVSVAQQMQGILTHLDLI